MTATAEQSVAILAASRRSRDGGVRLEELVYAVASEALRDAGVTRDDVDSVVLAAGDERDGRSISSMLTAVPAGGFMKEVTKVTDGSLHALALATMKLAAGRAEAVLVVSWDIASEAPVDAVAMSALEPFLDRPIGTIDPAATALLASAYLARTGGGPDAFDARARRKADTAGRSDGANGEWASHPLRRAHLAPERDGAAAVLLTTDRFARERGLSPVATVEGIGWRTDTYAPAERAQPLWQPLRSAVQDACARAGVSIGEIDSFELDDSSVFAEALAAEGVGLADEDAGLAFLDRADEPYPRRSDDGFAGVPPLCSGLWRLAQICAASRGDGLSLVHQAIGRAAQGHSVVIVRRMSTKRNEVV